MFKSANALRIPNKTVYEYVVDCVPRLLRLSVCKFALLTITVGWQIFGTLPTGPLYMGLCPIFGMLKE